MTKSRLISKLQKSSIEQRSEEWYKIRTKLITASDCGVILGYNTLSSTNKLMTTKLNNVRFENIYTKHGQYYEPKAIEIFEKKYKKKVYEVGLLRHQKHKFLGASPDGIVSNHYLIEIKCPYTRRLSGAISLNYYAQVQLQLEVANLENCYFYECVFKEVDTKRECKNLDCCGYNEDKKNWWYLADSNLLIIERNREWFARNRETFKKFHTELKNQHKTTKKGGKKRKRSLIFPDERPKKKRKTTKISTQSWINESKIRNFIIGDTLTDWLDLHGYKKYEREPFNPFTLMKFTKTGKFKTKILQEIEEIYPNRTKRLPYFNNHCIDLVLMTKTHMSNGVPVIIQGMLSDEDTKSYTTIDLLIRSDYVQKIFDKYRLKVDIKEGASYYSTKWFYVAFSLRYKILSLLSDGRSLSDDFITKMYKAQLTFQNELLGKVQGYTPSFAFLVGNGWKGTKGGKKTKKYRDWKKLGYLNFSEKDKHYIDDINNAMVWYRDVEKNGHKWKITPKPSRAELYPLIFSSQASGGWSNVKKQLAIKLKDISLLWQVGPKVRRKAHDQGIYTWDDPDLTPEVLGIKSDSDKGILLQKIIDINKMKRTKVLPKKITNNLNNWKSSNKVEFYVDFETLNSLYGGRPIIYLIGLTVVIPSSVARRYGTNNRKRDYSFVAESLTKAQEFSIIEQWINQMYSVYRKYDLNPEDVNIYCWSQAENNFLKGARERHNKQNSKKWNVKFTDVMEILKKGQVVVKGSLSGFGLKSISTALYNAGLIPLKYDSKCTSGEVSMASALSYYEHKLQEEMDDIIKYNTLDCQVIYEILTYLRKNHS